MSSEERNKKLDEIANEFATTFPPEVMERGIQDALLNERQASEVQERVDIQRLNADASRQLAKRRDFLLRALNVLDFALKSLALPENTTFGALFKIIGNKAIKLNEGKKEISANEDINLIAIFKLLVELKSENFNEQATLLEIIENLSQKFDALKEIE